MQRAGLALDIQSLGTGDAIAAAMVGGEVDIGSMNIVSLALAHQMLAIVVFTIAVVHAERLWHRDGIQSGAS